VRRERTGADELLEQLEHFRLVGNFSIRKRITADDPKMLRISKWRLVLPLTLRRKDRLELFFE
jgi:hypothetical protein